MVIGASVKIKMLKSILASKHTNLNELNLLYKSFPKFYEFLIIFLKDILVKFILQSEIIILFSL